MHLIIVLALARMFEEVGPTRIKHLELHLLSAYLCEAEEIFAVVMHLRNSKRYTHQGSDGIMPPEKKKKITDTNEGANDVPMMLTEKTKEIDDTQKVVAVNKTTKKKKFAVNEIHERMAIKDPTKENKDDKCLGEIIRKGFGNIYAVNDAKTIEQVDSCLHRVRDNSKTPSRFCTECASRNHNIRRCEIYLRYGREYRSPADIRAAERVINLLYTFHEPDRAIETDTSYLQLGLELREDIERNIMDAEDMEFDWKGVTRNNVGVVVDNPVNIDDEMSNGSEESTSPEDLDNLSVTTSGSSAMSIGKKNQVIHDTPEEGQSANNPLIIEKDGTMGDDSTQSSVESSESDERIKQYFDVLPMREQTIPEEICWITYEEPDDQYSDSDYESFLTKHGVTYIRSKGMLAELVAEHEYYFTVGGRGTYYDVSDDETETADDNETKQKCKDNTWTGTISSLRHASPTSETIQTHTILLGQKKCGADLAVCIKNARADMKSLLNASKKTMENAKKPSPIFNCGDIIINRNSVKTIQKVGGISAWFPDEVLNSFVWCWRTRMQMREKVYLHTSHVLQMLVSATTTKGISLNSLLVVFSIMGPACSRGARGLHLFPACNNKHWWLMIVDTESKMIYSIDSQDSRHRRDAALLASLFKVWLLRDNTIIDDMEDWKYEKLTVPENYQQRDDYNCGAFTCLYIANLAKYGSDAIETMRYLENYKGIANDLRLYVFQVLFQLGGNLR